MIKISEIQNNPPGLDRINGKWVNLDLEYIEIENTSNERINISGWKLKDIYRIKDITKQHEYTFPYWTWIEKKPATLKIRTGSKPDIKVQPNSVYQNRGAPIWNNDSDVAVLYDANGNYVHHIEVGEKVLGAIEGYVKDADTKEGLAGATVSGEMELQSVKTDASGKYLLQLAGVPRKLGGIKRKITAKIKDYANLSQNVTVYSGETVMAPDFLLNKGKEGDQIVIDLSIKDYRLRINRGIDIGLQDAGKIETVELTKDDTWAVEWNDDYDLIITYQNNKSPITAFGSTLNETTDKKTYYEVDKFNLPERAGTFLNNEIKAEYVNVPLKNWRWYKSNWWGGFDEAVIKKTFYYRVTSYGKHGNFPPNAEKNPDVEDLPKSIVVKVSEYKKSARDAYNSFRLDELGFWAMAIIGIVAGGVGWIIESAMLTLASILFGVGSLKGLSASQKKDLAKMIMEDPIRFIKKYKTLEQPRSINITKIAAYKRHKNLTCMMLAISNSLFSLQAIINTNSKLYSATKLGDSRWIEKHFNNKQKLKIQLCSEIQRAKKYYELSKPLLKKLKINKNLFKKALSSPKVISEAQKRYKIKLPDLKVLKLIAKSKDFKINKLYPLNSFRREVEALKHIYKSL